MLTVYSSATRKKLQRKQSKRSPSIYKWLRDRSSWVDFGQKWNGHPIHRNKNEDVLAAFNWKQWYLLERLSNKMLDAHFSGEETFYFAGNGTSRSDETLVLVDIDCHYRGTLEGAASYATFLRNTRFPNLYFEVSTNGNGVHAYLVLEKEQLGDYVINELLGRLQQELRKELSTQNFEVENVEIKGTCPVCTWGTKRGELANYKSGQLAKLPRQKERFHELRNTTKIHHADLRKLPPVARVVNKEVVGSVSGKIINDEEIAKLDFYRLIASTLMETHQIRTSGRAVATVEDVAIFMLLLKFFTGNMNADGSLPQARFKGMWQSLFEAGDIGRDFDAKRFKAIRDYMSSLGLLDWKDNQYVRPTEVNGVKINGKACKWKASEQLMSMLEISEAKTENMQENKDEQGISCMIEREETSLRGTTIMQVIQNLIQTPECDVIRPHVVENPSLIMPSAEEVTASVTCFEEFLVAA